VIAWAIRYCKNLPPLAQQSLALEAA
jgi:hypothetical protein